MNKAGLTFDFNAINWIGDFDIISKQCFPQGDDAILPHILANLSSVQEVIDLFETYWFQNGFRSAQMHVADRSGRFAIISASGVKLVEKGEFLFSTNFDICGKEDGASCWRYPIATNKLANYKASLETMMSICKETAQKNGNGLQLSFGNGENLVFLPESSNTFYFPHEDLKVEFSIDRQDKRMCMQFYEKGNWSFTALK